MLRDGRRNQQKEQPRRDTINGLIRNALRMPPEHDDRLIHETDQGVARVRQRDAVADAGAVELLALQEGAQQRFTHLRLAANAWNLARQFVEHGFAGYARQLQFYSCG